jgi:hypothetical protein
LVLIVSADLKIKRLQIELDAGRPLADRPIIYVIASDVAGIRTTECQVLKLTRKGSEIIGDAHPADFPVDKAVEIPLIKPKLSEPGGLSAPVELLNELQRVEPSIDNQVAPGALDESDLKQRIV